MNAQPISKQDLSQGETLEVKEIFYTIQGEGPWAGQPAVFLRLSGCNLCCTWCDTDYSNGERAGVYTIVDRIEKEYPSTVETRRVVITGGEPFRQNISQLVRALFAEGFEIQIETNGTLSIPHFPFPKALVVCSPKAGDIHPDILEHCDNYKYVVGTEGFPPPPTQKNGKKGPEIAAEKRRRQVWLMPRDDHNGTDANEQAAVELCLQLGYRLCVQLHKGLHLE